MISVITIPLSLIAAGLVLYCAGPTINTMVLAGFVIALGAVVDDAIVDIENIVRRLRQHRREAGRTVDRARHLRRLAGGARRGGLRVDDRGAGAAARLLPEGLTGAFFRPLAISYALAVLVSMVVALTSRRR